MQTQQKMQPSQVISLFKKISTDHSKPPGIPFLVLKEMTSTKINDLLLKLCILYFHEKWLN
jgi:hypothetical protein